MQKLFTAVTMYCTVQSLYTVVNTHTITVKKLLRLCTKIPFSHRSFEFQLLFLRANHCWATYDVIIISLYASCHCLASLTYTLLMYSTAPFVLYSTLYVLYSTVTYYYTTSATYSTVQYSLCTVLDCTWLTLVSTN